MSKITEYPKWLLDSIEAEKQGRTDEALDFIYTNFHDMLLAKQYEEANSLLEIIDCSKVPSDLLHSFAIVSRFTKTALPYRKEFVRKFKERLIQEAGYDAALSIMGSLEEEMLNPVSQNAMEQLKML